MYFSRRVAIWGALFLPLCGMEPKGILDCTNDKLARDMTFPDGYGVYTPPLNLEKKYGVNFKGERWEVGLLVEKTMLSYSDIPALEEGYGSGRAWYELAERYNKLTRKAEIAKKVDLRNAYTALAIESYIKSANYGYKDALEFIKNLFFNGYCGVRKQEKRSELYSTTGDPLVTRRQEL